MNHKSIVFSFILCVATVYFSVAQVVLHPDTADELTDTSESVTDAAEAKALLSVTRGKSGKTDSLIQYAYSFIGDRYRRGGTGAKGFDCSGYTMTVFKKFGVKLPHTSAGQGLVGYEINKANIKKGDLVLFRGRNRRSRRIGHVGIVISEKGEPVRFIHSSTSEGVRIDRLEFDYYRKRFVKAVRIPELQR